MGLELLFIDAQDNTIQAFISTNRIFRFETFLKGNEVYKLRNFALLPCKKLYKVSDNKHTICFTDQTSLIEANEVGEQLPSQHFRLRDFSEFKAIADRNEQLFDIIGTIRVIDGDNIHNQLLAEQEEEFQQTRINGRVTVHLQMKDQTMIRVTLWDTIGGNFRKKFNESVAKPSIILVTTVNPKRYQGYVSLNSTSATKIFFDNDIDATSQYLKMLGDEGPSSFTVKISASEVTKLEIVTIGDIQEFLSHNTPQTASFICTAQIVGLLEQYGWNYIACRKCTKIIQKAGSSLHCNECDNSNTVGTLRYRFELSKPD